MDVVPSEDGEQPTVLPLTSEMIGTINGIEPSILKSDHLRRIKRLLRNMISGCIVIVVRDEDVESIYQVKRFIIEPAE